MYIEDNYIKIKREKVNESMRRLLRLFGFRLKEDIYQAQDDALRRSIFNLPINRDTDIKSKYSMKYIQETYPYLMDYQVEDIYKMVQTEAILNANTMGLGKTLETIVTLDLLECDSVLIICPKSVRGSWKNELKKWLKVKDSDINIIEGSIKQRKEKTKNFKKYNIINYELLRDTRKEDTSNIIKNKWDAVVCDEGHRIKNRNAKQTIGIKKLKSKYKVVLTGTPIQNKPNDLWSILNWLGPYWSGKSYWRFVETFCQIEETFFGKEIVGLTKNEKAKDSLKKILNEIMIRRETSDSLPDIINIPIRIPMSKKQQQLYKKVQKDILIELEENNSILINSALTRLIRLQQCTSNTEKFDIKKNPKFEFIKDLAEDNPENKIVIFSRFKETVYALDKYLNTKNVLFTGDTKDRDKAIEQFKEDEETQMFIATIGAAGEGINGLQEVSNVMVFIDLDFSPAKNEQAIGRLKRQGQKDKVIVYKLFMENTIDEHVEKVLDKKTSDIIQLLENIED